MAGKMAQTEKKCYRNRHLLAGSPVTSLSVGSLLRNRAGGLLAAAAAMALPVGMAQAGGPIQVANVAAGTAAFSQAGSVTTITAANNTIINYQKFGIPHGNTVDFVQPSASARVLNRIIGPSPTQIDGNLNANGVVYFVNPAGVMFGAGAVVNVGQLYAAAGHMSDGDFLSGVNAFTDNTGSITNAGVIKAGDVTFSAQNISNNGTILTPTGMVVMAAGKDVYVSILGSPFLVRVAGTSGSNLKRGETGVSNSGTINASGGDVAIRAGDMYSLAINNSGTIKASNVSIKAAGADSTVLVSGKIDASNQGTNSTGGTISVNGGQIGIGVTADAAGNYHDAAVTLDASGANGGGKILIGVKPDPTSATGYSDASAYDFIGPSAVLNASATSTGNGGLVDTSGQVLDVSPGAVITAAGAGGGSAGEWLLDPRDVTISTAADSHVSGTGTNPETFSPGATGSNLNTGTLDSALAANTGVIVNTVGSGSDAGNITVADAINPLLTADSTLTLNATNGIDIEAGIAPATGSASTATLGLALNAGGNLTSGSGLGNAIFINAPINTNGGAFSATASGGTTLAITLAAALSATNSSSNNGAAVTFTSSGTVGISSSGSINVSGNNSSTQGGGNAGSITISGVNGVSVNGNLTAAGGNSLASGSTGGPGGGILISSASGTINLSGVTINTAGGSDGTTSDGGGGGVGIDATGAGAISLSGVTINTSSQGVGGAGAIALYSGTGTIAIAGSTLNSSGAGGGAAGIQTGADVTLSGANIITTSGGTGATSGGGGGISGTAASLVVGGGSGNGGAGNGGGISGGAASQGSSSPNSSGGGSTSGGSSGGGAPGAAGVLTVTGSGTGNSITVNGPITGSTGAATFSSPTINLNASISAPVSVAGTGVNLVAVGSSGSYKGDIQQGVSLLASDGTLDLTALAGTTSSDNVIFALPIEVLGPTTGAVTAASWATSVSTAAVTISGELSASATTGDGFNFTGTTTVSGNATLDSPGSAQIFDGTVGLGSNSLTLAGVSLNASPAAGAAFSGSTGSSLALNFSGGANLGTISGLGVLDGIGTGTYTLNNDISTTAGQTYNGPVTLGSATIALTANSGSTASSVTFGSTVDSAATGGSSADNSVAITGDGVFNGPVGSSDALGTLAVSGTTSLSGNVTTINGQTYTGAVALAGTPIKLSGTTLNASSRSGASFTGAGETLNLDFNSSANLGAISTLGILEDTGSGTSTLNGNITTTGAQSYAGAVTLAATPITLTANSGSVVQTVTFGRTVDGADTLNIGSTGTVSNAVFGGNVGGTINLAALNVSGTTTLSGNVTTVGGQVYAAAVTLDTNTTLAGTTLNASPASGALFTGARALTLNFSGTANLGTVSSLGTLNGTGTGGYTLNGNITTTNGQTYAGTVTLNAGTVTLADNGTTGITLSSVIANSSQNLALNESGTGSVSLNGSIASPGAFSITTAGTVTLAGAITAGDLTISSSEGSSPISVPIAITIRADTQSFSATGTGATLGIAGLTNLQLADTAGNAAPQTIVLTQDATVQDADLPALTLFHTDTIAGTSYTIKSLSGNIDLADGGITPVSGANLTLTANNGNILLGSSGALTLDSLIATPATTGAITLSGNVFTTGLQTYTGPVVLGASDTLTANNGTTAQLITFDRTVDGADSLNIGASGDVSNVVFAGDVGGTTSLAALNVSGTSSLGGNVSTAGSQTYTGNVTLADGGTAKTFTLLAAANTVAFGGTVNGTNANDSTLDIGNNSTSTNATFGGAVGGTAALAVLTVQGSTSLGGNVTTGGAQSYNGTVLLAATPITLGGTTLNNSATPVVFSGSGDALTLDFGGGVNLGPISNLGSLSSIGSGATTLNGNITTSGAQSYNGTVLLAATPITLNGTTLNSSATPAVFSGSGDALTLNFSSGANLGTISTLGSLSSIGSGTTTLNGNITTGGTQSYNGTVLLAATPITLGGTTLNNSATPAVFSGSGDALTLNFSSGANLGTISTLGSLSSIGSGTTTLNGNITTSGAQSYNGTVFLAATPITMAGTTLNSSATPAVFSGSGDALTLNFSGGVNLGTISTLGSLISIGAGTTTLNGNITTSGAQSYNGTVLLAATPITLTGTTLNSSATPVVFSGSGDALTLNFSSGANLGTISTLGSLISIGAGTTTLNGNITTGGAQSYNGTVLLAATPITLGGTTLNNSATPAVFSGSGDALTLNFSSGANLGTISTLGSLNTTGSGTTTLNGNITTSGAQSYNGAVLLAATPITLAGTTLNNSATPAVFSGSGDALTLNFSSGANLGTISTLGSLSSIGAGTTTLNGNITTGGAQSYNGTVLLAATPITLTGTTLNNSATPVVFSGSGDALTLNFSGGANLGTISTLGSLSSIGAGATTLNGNIATSGEQSYNGTVFLAATPITLTGTTLNNSATPAVFSGSGDTLTLNFGGGANLGTISTLGSLSSIGSGATTLNGNITTSGAQSYNGTVLLAATPITLTGTTLNSSGTPVVFSGSGDALTLNFSSGANLGTISTLGSLISIGAGTTTLNGNITTGGAQSYNGTVLLAATPITLTGTTLNNSATPVVFSGSGDALTLNFSGSVNLGTISTLGSLSSIGSGTTTLNGDITTSGNQSYGTAVAIASSLTLTGESLNPTPVAAAIFNGAQVVTPALTLSFNNSYNINFGATSGLASLALTTASLVPLNIPASITLTYPLTVAGAVAVGQSSSTGGTIITLAGPSFNFGSSFDAVSPNDSVLFAKVGGTGGNVSFGGVVGGTATNPDLGALTVQGAAAVNGGAVNTVNGQIYNGAITIANSGTTAFTSTQGGIEEDGGITDSGSVALIPSSALMVPNPDPILGAGVATGDFRPQSYLTINGSISAGGNISLAPNAPTFAGVSNPIPDAATIITTIPSGTVTVTGQNISMGQNQKWTSLTSLMLNANVSGGSNVATLGDMNVAGDLTVNAKAIDMLLRPSGSQLVPGTAPGLLGLHINTPGTEGVDFVANTIALTGAIVPVGASSDYAPQFAYGASGTVTGSITPGSRGVHYYGVNISPTTLMATQLANGQSTSYYLDLKASGPSISNVTVAVTPIIPPPPPQFHSVVVLSSEQREILREAGINARNTSIDNLLNLFGGKAVFNDIPTSDGMIIVHPTLLDYYVTTSRLPYQQTREFIAMYRQVFLAPVINPKTHKPELDKKGNVVYRSRRMELHGLFRDSFNSYSKAVGAAHATALGFRIWLEKTPGQAKVLITLNQLRALLAQVRQLGLTSVELRLSHSTILAELNPEALSERQFEEAVLGRKLSNL